MQSIFLNLLALTMTEKLSFDYDWRDLITFNAGHILGDIVTIILLHRMLYFINFCYIMITCPCNVYPLTPHFYVYRGIHTFLIFALKHILWVLVRTASVRRF